MVQAPNFASATLPASIEAGRIGSGAWSLSTAVHSGGACAAPLRHAQPFPAVWTAGPQFLPMRKNKSARTCSYGRAHSKKE